MRADGRALVRVCEKARPMSPEPACEEEAWLLTVVHGDPVQARGHVRVGEIVAVIVKVATTIADVRELPVARDDRERLVIVQDRLFPRQVAAHRVDGRGDVGPRGAGPADFILGPAAVYAGIAITGGCGVGKALAR